MSKLTKVITNYNKTVGTIWESNNKEVIVFDKDISLDLNNGLQVREAYGNDSVEIDLIDLISEAMSKLKEDNNE
jgi:hypothetical protein